MRTTIAFKLAMAAIVMVVLSLGTMAWVTSRNIESGFIAYLNELQRQHLDQVKDILTEQYRARGNFDWLRRNPRALNDLIAQRNGDIHPETDDPPPRRDDPEAPIESGCTIAARSRCGKTSAAGRPVRLWPETEPA